MPLSLSGQGGAARLHSKASSVEHKRERRDRRVVEFGPRAKAAEHAEVVDQEERDLDGRTEDGWMQEGWACLDPDYAADLQMMAMTGFGELTGGEDWKAKMETE